MTFSQQQLAPSRSWKPCFQNPLDTYPIPNHLPTPRNIISHPSWAGGSSSSCPQVLSCFNKTTILHQRHLKNFFLVLGSGPHLYSKTSSAVILWRQKYIISIFLKHITFFPLAKMYSHSSCAFSSENIILLCLDKSCFLYF